ncbi:MAG TPA: peptidase M16, partial [Myxococcales bacterium]|nr:peptidase M16 [Myxococcales bacterium]
DKTCSPVASQNEQDFYNLVDVYLDAVFFPRITRDIFEQEGWHYELEDAQEPLIYKGVVFNEMKGVYSSPDNLLYRAMRRFLYKEGTYHQDSGGDPEVIPDLTYEQFKTFHEQHYHPSNARLFFYGDDDIEKRFVILDEYLSQFEQVDVSSTAVPIHAHVPEHRRIEQSFDAGEGEDKKGMMCLSWLLEAEKTTQLSMDLGLLSYMLMSTPASPLRKILLDSGLGEDLTGGGLSSGLRQMSFSAGLKGIAVEDVEKIEQLILDSLQDIARVGFEPEMVEAAFNTVEFQLRENNTGSYPRGLALMISCLDTWLHDGDPMEGLGYEEYLETAKKNAEKERYFEELIETHLLQNQHRVTIVLKPEQGVRQKVEEAEKKRLAEIKEKLSEDEIQSIIENTAKLKKMQETPDPPEAIAKLPSLTLDDLDKNNKLIPVEKGELNGAELLTHDLFTNGIIYLDVGFNLRALPLKYIPYIKLFGRALLEVGTKTEDYTTLAQRIRRKTGGIWSSSMISSVREQKEAATWFFLRGKATMAQADDMLDILRDVLLTVDFDNQERFKQMVLRSKAGMESGLIPSGHGIVNTRLRGQFDEAGWLGEQLGGVSYLFFLRELAEKVENDWSSVRDTLEDMRKLLLNRNAMICNVTLDQKNMDVFSSKLSSFVGDMPTKEHTPLSWEIELKAIEEGLTLPAQVNYVAKGANLFDLGYKLSGSSLIMTRFLRTTWLWEKVRVQGGAYGGMCGFNLRSGVFTFLSYRDPNLLKTIENYDLAGTFLRDVEINELELTRNIIGAIGDMDDYQLPDAKGYTSLYRHLLGETDEQRQTFREQVLGTTIQDFRDFADMLDQVKETGRVVVLGSKEAIESANGSLSQRLNITRVL